MPERHDMMLTAFERDSAQWAYLVHVPSAGRWRAEAEVDIRGAFDAVGKVGKAAWFRTERDKFEQLKEELFLTKDERFERANTPLWEEGGSRVA